MSLRRNLSVALLVGSLASACDPYVRTTVVELRDPSQVQYATTSGRPIAANGKPAVISDDDVRYQGNHISEMIVTGERAPDGTLKTAWRTDPDLFHDTHALDFHPATMTVLPDQDSVAMTGDTLSYSVCGAHADSGIRFNGQEHFAVGLGSSCNSRRNDFQIEAVTPMSNVKSVRYEYEADRSRPILTALAVSMLTTGIASILLVTPGDRSTDASAASKTEAGVVFALGGAIDLGLVLSAIFARDHEEVIYQGAH